MHEDTHPVSFATPATRQSAVVDHLDGGEDKDQGELTLGAERASSAVMGRVLSHSASLMFVARTLSNFCVTCPGPHYASLRFYSCPCYRCRPCALALTLFTSSLASSWFSLLLLRLSRMSVQSQGGRGCYGSSAS